MAASNGDLSAVWCAGERAAAADGPRVGFGSATPMPRSCWSEKRETRGVSSCVAASTSLLTTKDIAVSNGDLLTVCCAGGRGAGGSRVGFGSGTDGGSGM
eukprot:7362068-Prymnesium_polylepis.3